MRIRRGAAVVTAALLLAACSEEVRGVASPEPSATPPSRSSAAPVPPPAPEPGDPVPDAGDTSGPATPGSADDAPEESRVAGIAFRSDGSSAQVVVNLSGSGVPEWTVGYSDATGADGEPVDIAGDAFLRVRVRTDASAEGQGTSRTSVSVGPVAETRTIGAADGYEEVLIGVRGGERPFHVEALTDPGRIVVEIEG